MSKLTSTRINMIGAQSLRWPSVKTVQWDALRAVVTKAREIVTLTDAEIDIAERDADLSATGRLKRIGDIALKAIERLENGTELPAAEKAVQRFVTSVEERRGALPSVSDDLSTAMQLAEVRAMMAKQEHPLNWAMHHRAEPMVVAAVNSAPALLCGLKAEERETFLQAAKTALWPDDEKLIKQNTAALEVARNAIGEAVRLIADRGQLLKTADSYTLRPTAKASA